MAWFTDFPSRTERLMWLIASIAPTILPLANLVLSFGTRKVLTHRASKRAWNMLRRYFLRREAGSVVTSKEEFLPVGYGIAFGIDEQTHMDKELALSLLRDHKLWSSFRKWGAVLNQFQHNGSLDPASSSLWKSLKEPYADIRRRGITLISKRELPIEMAPEGFPVFRPVHETDIKSYEITISALNDPEELWTKELSTQERLRNTADGIATFYVYGAWAIYLVARVMILALAFAALRSQDEGVYLVTRTRNLPSFD